MPISDEPVLGCTAMLDLCMRLRNVGFASASRLLFLLHLLPPDAMHEVNDGEEELQKQVKVTPTVHKALMGARVGPMSMNDVIADALQDYEPRNPSDPQSVLNTGDP